MAPGTPAANGIDADRRRHDGEGVSVRRDQAWLAAVAGEVTGRRLPLWHCDP